MAIGKFYALTEGTIPWPFDPSDGLDSKTLNLHVADLGTLTITSGFVLAGDPLVDVVFEPQFPIAPGEYPIKVTVADFSEQQDGSNLRNAYLSLILRQGDTATVEFARPKDCAVADEDSSSIDVGAGLVSFTDPLHYQRYMPPVDDGVAWTDIFFDSGPESWSNIIDSEEHYPKGMANILLPAAKKGENIILVYTPWGNGVYPVVVTRDSQGQPLGLHIDMKAWD
ncbi:MAG: DUF4241 domain-containing protein [Actinomycetaceae bacterium]|nr:DUF4241 domain-containing protein [Actinomycetaceae bacterium]